MIKDHLGIISNHLEEIEKSDDVKYINNIILETVKLLLDKKNFDYSNTVLSNYNETEIRMLFSDFCNIAQTVCVFFQKTKTYLDPVALKGEIGRSLERTTGKLTEIIDLTASNEQLENERKEIENKESLYNDKKRKLTILKEKKQKYTYEAIVALENEIQELEEKLNTNRLKRTQLKNSIKKYKTKLDTLSNVIKQKYDEKKNIEENLIVKINEKSEQIKNIIKTRSDNLEEIRNKIEDYRNQYVTLRNKSNEIKNEYEESPLYFVGIDEERKKLIESGIPITNNIISDFKKFDNVIMKEIEKLDNIIKVINVEQEKEENLRNIQQIQRKIIKEI
jgi:chromosome segregation ATPase